VLPIPLGAMAYAGWRLRRHGDADGQNSRLVG
jgi:hypothetical protein